MWCTTKFSFGTSFFLMYINDLPNKTYKCNFTLFADDTTLTCMYHNLNDRNDSTFNKFYSSFNM